MSAGSWAWGRGPSLLAPRLTRGPPRAVTALDSDDRTAPWGGDGVHGSMSGWGPPLHPRDGLSRAPQIHRPQLQPPVWLPGEGS